MMILLQIMPLDRKRKVVVVLVLALVVAWLGFLPGGADGDGVATFEEVQQGTDPMGADSDGDELRDGEEAERGTDPLVADSDGDELLDGTEVSGYWVKTAEGRRLVQTNPTVADTDGDGLSDSREKTLQLNPDERDADSDGLTDAEECEVGTHPSYDDTDGDNLPDSWEVNGTAATGARLPDADPLHKDMYVMFTYGKGIQNLTDAQRRSLESTWAEMPVGNPDGTEGITLHIVESVHATERFTIRDHGLNEENVYPYVMDYTSDRLKRSAEDLPRGATPDRRHDVYFHVLVVELTQEPRGSVGLGSRGSDSVIVVGKAPDWNFDAEYRYLVTHELLHNVVGHLDPANRASSDAHQPKSHSKYDGFLSATHENEYLPEEIGHEIERDGFVYGPESPPNASAPCN